MPGLPVSASKATTREVHHRIPTDRVPQLDQRNTSTRVRRTVADFAPSKWDSSRRDALKPSRPTRKGQPRSGMTARIRQPLTGTEKCSLDARSPGLQRPGHRHRCRRSHGSHPVERIAVSPTHTETVHPRNPSRNDDRGVRQRLSSPYRHRHAACAPDSGVVQGISRWHRRSARRASLRVGPSPGARVLLRWRRRTRSR